MQLVFPNPSLVLLIGAAGAGKSSFARMHFSRTQIISSDRCRAFVCGDESDQSATSDAFELLYLITEKRLLRRLSTVVDATNVDASARSALLSIAARHGVAVAGIVFDLTTEECIARMLSRRTRVVAAEKIRAQRKSLDQALASLPSEGFSVIYTLSAATMANVTVTFEA